MFQCNYGMVREKDRTDSPILKTANNTFTKRLFICSRSFLSHSLITANLSLLFMCYQQTLTKLVDSMVLRLENLDKIYRR